MNTLSILDAESSNIPEGLYLKLVNALKLDFETPRNPDKEHTLGLFFEGWIRGAQEIDEPKFYFLAAEILNDHCTDQDMIKRVFEDGLRYSNQCWTYNTSTQEAEPTHFENYNDAIEYVDDWFFDAWATDGFWYVIPRLANIFKNYSFGEDVWIYTLNKLMYGFIF